MAITEREYDAATARGETTQLAFPSVIDVRYNKRTARLVFTMTTDVHIAVRLADIRGLENVDSADLVDPQISPSGLGVHFPKADVDIYIPSLLEACLGLQRWLAAQRGKAGGSARTPAKADAARANGKRGGRPRIVVPAAGQPPITARSTTTPRPGKKAA
ncbi:DUF2442 domain-containing protein [Alcaligenaceae bacterium A4P071]|nr:DUF2442 domain-containing protein [Alcaligenaceae bacterium A4P071]